MNVSISSRAGVRNLRTALTPKDSLDYLIALYFVFLLIGFWSVTRLDLYRDGFEITSPHVISGDEPHYLLVVNSILFDHDLELQQDYARAENGPDAGGISLPDHHTIIVNSDTGEHSLWFKKAARDAEFGPGPNVYEVSSHPVAYPAVLAGLVAPFRPKIEDVQRDASLVVVLVCWLGVLLTFRLARRVGMSRGYALLSTVLLALASPWLAYTRSFYPEPMIGLAAVAALLALETQRPVRAGFASAAAAMLEPSMLIIGVGFVIERMFERRRAQAVRILLVLVAIAIAVMIFNNWLAYTPNISGASGVQFNQLVTSFNPLTESFFGGDHGLFVWCPWTIFAIFPIALALCNPALTPAVISDMRLPMFFQLILIGVWGVGAGMSYGPRQWVAFLPWMAVAAVEIVRTSNRAWRVVFYLMLAISLPISIIGAFRYPELYSLSPLHLWPKN